MTWLVLRMTQHISFIDFAKLLVFLPMFGQFDSQIFAILVVPIKISRGRPGPFLITLF